MDAGTRFINGEYRILRPVMLITSGLLVLGIVLYTCREAAEQRARFIGNLRTGVDLAGSTSCPALKSTAVLRVFPPTSLPGTSKAGAPGID
jgi:hypothetical protein